MFQNGAMFEPTRLRHIDLETYTPNPQKKSMMKKITCMVSKHSSFQKIRGRPYSGSKRKRAKRQPCLILT